MKSFVRHTALALALSCIAGTASAQFYVGGDVGSTRAEGLSSSTGIGLFAGYDFNQYFSVEAGYRRLGNFDVAGTGNKLRLNTTQVSAIGGYPIGDSFKVYARLGYSFLTASGSSSYNIDNAVLLGFGGQYAITKDIALRAEYSRVASDVRQINLGVAYKF